MRYLIVSPKPPLPKVDGGCIAKHSFAASLVDGGNQVHVLAVSTEKHPFVSSAFKSEKYTIESVYVNTKVRVKDAFGNLFKKSSYNVDRFYSIAFQEVIAAELQANDYEVVVLESIYVGPYYDLIRENFKGKLLLRMHNFEFRIWEQLSAHTKNLAKKKYLKLLSKRLHRYEKELLGKVDAVMPVSSLDTIRLEDLGWSKKVKYVPVTVKIKEHHKHDDLRIGYIGSMDWLPNREGIDWFIDEVWPKVLKKCEVSFRLAGRGDMEKYQVPGVEVIGEVADADAFMDDLDVLIVPLLTGSGIRIKILDAIAMGKLVVTTVVGGEGISSPSVVKATSPNEFASAIVKMTKNKDVSAQVEAGFKYISDYHSVEAVNKAMEEVLR